MLMPVGADQSQYLLFDGLCHQPSSSVNNSATAAITWQYCVQVLPSRYLRFEAVG